jgi:hypothetical protein
MSDDNTQDGAEPSPASGGSQPVAWAVFGPDGHCVGTYESQAHAQIVIEEASCDGMAYEPLYRQPGPALSGDERLAVEWASVIAREQSQVALHKTLRSLLERLG